VPRLDLDTYRAGRRAAPGWDVYYLEQEWKIVAEAQLAAGDAFLRDYPDEHFVVFCLDWYKKHGRPSKKPQALSILESLKQAIS